MGTCRRVGEDRLTRRFAKYGLHPHHDGIARRGMPPLSRPSLLVRSRTSMRPPSDDVSPIYKAPTAPCDGEIFARTLPPWPRRRLPWRPRRPRVGAPTYGTDRLNDASIRPLGRAGSLWPCISTSRVPGLEAASSVGVTPCSRPRLKMASRGTAHARIVGCSQLCQHAYLLLAGGARAYVMYGRIKAPDEGC